MLVLMMFGYDFRHEDRHLVRSIEFASLLAGIGSKIAYQIFIYIAQHIIVLRTVGRNIPDQLDEVFQGTGLACRVFPQLAQSCLQTLEDAVIHGLVVGTDQTVERVQRHRHIGNGKGAVGLQPCGEEVLVFDEVAYVVLAVVDDDF